MSDAEVQAAIRVLERHGYGVLRSDERALSAGAFLDLLKATDDFVFQAHLCKQDADDALAKGDAEMHWQWCGESSAMEQAHQRMLDWLNAHFPDKDDRLEFAKLAGDDTKVGRLRCPDWW